MRTITERMKQVPYAGIRVVYEKAKKLESQGKKIIHMEIGRPDFDTPAVIKEKAIDALQKGFVHYTSNFGLDELREAVARKMTEENQVPTNFQEVIITPGASAALAVAILGLLDIDEEVLIPSPLYPAYPKLVTMAGGIPVTVPLNFKNGFKLTVDALEKRVTDKTKMLIINTPHNPTGAVYGDQELSDIAEFVREKDLIVIADECYEKIVFDGEHISMARLPGMKERTVTVNSTSKTFSMTGWRIGFLTAPLAMINSIVKVQQNLTICAPSFAQIGSIVAYEKGEELIKEMISEFTRRKSIVTDWLQRTKKIEYVEPGGSLYVFPSIHKLGMSSEQFSDYILNEAGVAVAPGKDFGPNGEGFVRIAFTCSTQELTEGMEKIKKAIDRL
ncbi:MAG: pyridoxal phosphate-dependent aminotransferase [Halanaerobiales bacterium]|nr:pyridoxal phosphate-dependent aminotransferase [Halanaerobiales bacterium]